MTNDKHITTIATLALAGLAIALAGGCRGDRTEARPRQFLPDMDDSPKFKPQTPTPFFADGRAMRRPVEGVVAFGSMEDVGVVTANAKGQDWAGKLAPRDRYLKEDDAFFRGRNADGSFVERIPAGVVIDAAALERGQEKFNITCSACHGYDGKGKGTVGLQWSYPLPNFHDPKYYDAKVDAEKSRDGYIFHVIRNGVAGTGSELKMPAYGYNITPADAWKIVAYFRTLQAAQLGKPADLPEAERNRLNQTKVNQTKPAPAATTPAAPAAKEGSK